MSKLKLNPDNVYDPLAKDYDAILYADPTNKKIRGYIKNISLKYLTNKSTALDFGGGTGQDLSWLSKSAGNVLFCEPSLEMRIFAEELIKDQQLKNVTLVAETDFKKWDFTETLPNGSSLDFILSNFAVLNSIFEIESLFDQLEKALKKDGVLIISVLHGFPKKYKRLKVLRKIINKFRFWVVKESIVLENTGHNTIIHTHKKIMSSAKNFHCLVFNKVPHSMFTLYVFRKK